MNQASQAYKIEESKINNDQNDTLSSFPNNHNHTLTTDEPDLKIIIIGDSAVGKTKLIERYLHNDFNPRRLSTHALTIYRKHVTLDDQTTIKVDFWDTAGQSEKFSSLHPMYFYQAHACILVFDVTRKSTYHNLQKWHDELLLYSSLHHYHSTKNNNNKSSSIPCILAANKIDINKDVTKKSFKFATDNHMPFYFCSCADGTNVVRMFEEAICRGLGWKKKKRRRDFLSECLEFLEDGPLKI